ncbi:hypothetical protein CRUP_030750, partial [Coryphaenoides rupestris]
MVPLKRRKVASAGGAQRVDHGGAGAESARFPHHVIFILERRMGASRRAFLAQLGRRKGESVTHVISENNTGDEVRTWLGEGGGQPVGDQSGPPVHLLDISWYTESMREGRPVAILDRYRLQDVLENGSSREVQETQSSPRYRAMK